MNKKMIKKGIFSIFLTKLQICHIAVLSSVDSTYYQQKNWQPIFCVAYNLVFSGYYNIQSSLNLPFSFIALAMVLGWSSQLIFGKSTEISVLLFKCHWIDCLVGSFCNAIVGNFYAKIQYLINEKLIKKHPFNKYGLCQKKIIQFGIKYLKLL